jgi:hypothetical protein
MVEARTGLRPDGDRYDVHVSHPAERERCAALLAELAVDLVATGLAELGGLSRYFHHLGIAADTPLCLVDLGHRRIACITPLKRRSGIAKKKIRFPWPIA